MDAPSFPYPYGSDLHWLWGWGQRIDDLQCRENYVPGELDCMIFRPDRNAADAMMRFGIDFPTVIGELKEQLSHTEAAFQELLAEPNDDTREVLADRMQALSHRIRIGTALIAERQVQSTSNLGLIDRLFAGPDHAELTPSELALLEAYLKQPSNRPTLGELADAANGREPSERAAGLEKLKLIRDYNRNLQSVAAKPAIEPKPDTTSAETPKRRGRPKADYETVQRETQIAADWKEAKEAGTYKGDFARDRGTTVAELDALLDRVAKRNRPSE